MQSWEVVAGGRACTVSAAVAPNGKVMVRVAGKIVTPPIAPAENGTRVRGRWLAFSAHPRRP
ncbi:MAG TPA: hypothetical protein VKB93_27060 [Thermoanaerobaculia bacterium]|nr:hypothetical protein [Thermoanaerobaculia bacterium]